MTKLKKPKNKIRLGIVLAMIISVALTTAYVVQQRLREQREERTYTRLEQILDELSNQVEQVIGAPIQKETKGYCAKTGEKYKEGKLYCGVRNGANFRVNSVNEAKDIANKYLQLLGQNPDLINLVQAEATELSDRWTQYLTTSIEQFTCSTRLSYLSVASSAGEGIVGDPSPGTFGYIIRCTDFASKEHFPVGY